MKKNLQELLEKNDILEEKIFTLTTELNSYKLMIKNIKYAIFFYFFMKKII